MNAAPLSHLMSSGTPYRWKSNRSSAITCAASCSGDGLPGQLATTGQVAHGEDVAMLAVDRERRLTEVHGPHAPRLVPGKAQSEGAVACAPHAAIT